MYIMTYPINMYPVVVIIISVVVWFIFDVTIDVVREFRKENRGYKSNVPMTQLVHQTILFTNDILCKNGIKHFPSFEIRYYKHSKWAGFHSNNGMITIYLKSHQTISQIVDTTLHEVSHHISMKVKNDSWVRYDELMKIYGYHNHPEELKARSFASKHLDDCLTYLENRKIITSN